MAEMYGSYSDEDLNEWERMPQNIRVLTSSAFGAWLLRRDKNMKEPKTGHWIETGNKGHIDVDSTILYQEMCDKCKGLSYFRKSFGKFVGAEYCPNCGAKMEAE